MKGILTKEKIDRQLPGQSTASAPFMKVSKSYISSNKKAVSFNTLERTDNKIDRLTSLVNKMSVKMDKCYVQFKSQIYQRNRRGQNRCNYNQNEFQARDRSFSIDRRISYRGREKFDWNYRQNYRRRPHNNFRGDYKRANYMG